MKPIVLAAVLAVAVLPVPAAAQPQAPAGYAPGLGEIMTLTQMRHLKLWFAGDAKNWELADYELDELKEGFDDAIEYSDVRCRMSDVGCRMSDVRCRMSDVRSPTSDLRSPISDIRQVKSACPR
ncbi:MAG TPA: hypothetical protein VEM36_08765 [Xanthobacteraceae bacterium]|nr:hypothetical protein [Xanthobacteraceae bacterium]